MSNKDEFTALQSELRSLDGRRSEILKRLVKLQESQVQNAVPIGKPARLTYDRMFPNQDVMPNGGFGNLIALPLQKLARESGNTVFVDDKFKAIDDQ